VTHSTKRRWRSSAFFFASSCSAWLTFALSTFESSAACSAALSPLSACIAFASCLAVELSGVLLAVAVVSSSSSSAAAAAAAFESSSFLVVTASREVRETQTPAQLRLKLCLVETVSFLSLI
jgi:hypothetical protein